MYVVSKGIKNYNLTHGINQKTKRCEITENMFYILEKKLGTLFFDHCFPCTCHSTNELQDVVGKWFCNSIRGKRDDERLLALLHLICSPSDPKPSQLGLGQGTVEDRSSDASLSFKVK